MDILSLSKKAKDNGTILNKSANLDDLCPACKRNGRIYCPHKSVLAIKSKLKREFDKQDFFGPSPPNLFVGHHGYPTVNWGPTISLDDKTPDNPKFWYGWNFDKIVYARSTQVIGKVSSKVFSALSSPGYNYVGSKSRILRNSQESAMSYKAIDIETHFSKKPNLDVNFNSITQPMGPSAPLEKLTLAENPKIPKKVDALVDDGALANIAIKELMHAGYDEHYLTRLLTCGVLGEKKKRRLVPTKWGITAVDDILAKEHLEKIRYLDENSKYLLYQNQYLANKFTIVLLPGKFEYENFEAWVGDKSNYALSQEYEPYLGRKSYAKKQGGGYYAARLAVVEALNSKLKKQARVIVFREILPEYDLPVGVWEIRENVRHAMKRKPLKFDSYEHMQNYLSSSLILPLSIYYKKSEILRQRKLSDF